MFTAFDARQRIAVDPLRVQWLVLPKLFAMAEQLCEHMQEVKAGGGPPKLRARALCSLGHGCPEAPGKMPYSRKH